MARKIMLINRRWNKKEKAIKIDDLSYEAPAVGLEPTT